MKSVIMALFLMSVSLGNLFTAAVNNYIMVPDGLAETKALVAGWGLEEGKSDVTKQTHANRSSTAAALAINYHQTDDGGFELLLKGWEESIGDDDIRVGYGPDLERRSLVTAEVASIMHAVDRIGQFWDEHDRLPFVDEGTTAIALLKDPWGKPMHYQLVNRRNFVLSSEGPDKSFMTQNDVRAQVAVTSHTVEQQVELNDSAMTGGGALSSLHPEFTWIAVRKAEIAAEKARDAGDATASYEQFLEKETHDSSAVEKQNHNFKITWQIGGATTLAGASYFEFFTWLMLGTAILFVAVAF